MIIHCNCNIIVLKHMFFMGFTESVIVCTTLKNVRYSIMDSKEEKWFLKQVILKEYHEAFHLWYDFLC
jgi:hypothetical protein